MGVPFDLKAEKHACAENRMVITISKAREFCVNLEFFRVVSMLLFKIEILNEENIVERSQEIRWASSDWKRNRVSKFQTSKLWNKIFSNLWPFTRKFTCPFIAFFPQLVPPVLLHEYLSPPLMLSLPLSLSTKCGVTHQSCACCMVVMRKRIGFFIECRVCPFTIEETPLNAFIFTPSPLSLSLSHPFFHVRVLSCIYSVHAVDTHTHTVKNSSMWCHKSWMFNFLLPFQLIFVLLQPFNAKSLTESFPLLFSTL